MNLSDLPATVTVRNAGPLTVGVAHLSIPAGGSLTINLAAMGLACKGDIWRAMHAARTSGLITTSPVTFPVSDTAISAPADGHDTPHSDWLAAPADGHVGFRVMPLAAEPEVSAPVPVAAPRRDPRARMSAAFSAAGNSPYVSILLHI